MLDAAAREVAKMWKECAELSDVQRASAEDTIHFIHEEASEVVKCAMHMGLMGDKEYYRSDDARAMVYTWENLIAEVGDVILMALTLAEALDVKASVCLQSALDKFYARARAKAMREAEANCTRIANPHGRIETAEEARRYTDRETLEQVLDPNAQALRTGLGIIEQWAKAAVSECPGFVSRSDDGEDPYCGNCAVHKEYHEPGGADRLSCFVRPGKDDS
jgi:NTP pyrophosphatase (non-canonical NTP hydrolase)